MKQKYLYSLLLLFGLLTSVSLQAGKNYSCDFETEADRLRWKLNLTATPNMYEQLTNKWFIGEQGNNDKTGQYGLYISDDDGITAHYSNNACWVVAFDTVTLDKLLPTSNEPNPNYVLAFDYCGQGNVNSMDPVNGSADGIYLMWIPVEDGVTPYSIANTFSSIPTDYDPYIIPLQLNAGMDYVGRTQTWKTYVGTIKNSLCDGKPHLLAFVWANKSMTAQQPGGKIDNIFILDERPCDEPKNLKLTIQGTTSTISWTGSATMEYEVIAYSYETDTWSGTKTVTGTSISFTNLPMGQTDFIVRTKCNEDLYSVKAVLSDFVYYPDEQCIPFLLLDNTNCYVARSKVSGDTWMNSMQWDKEYVDYGAMSEQSRHTKHFRKDEYDPRTVADDGTPGLRTVPDGELASVRLGNWLTGSEAERIEFKYHVDAKSAAVMMLKYAIVLQKPNDGCKPNPGFLLRVLDKNKNLISDCASADFDYKAAAASGDPTWHESHPGSATDVVKWKDWTPVGVNLSAYDGQDLTVQLTSYDCGGGGHYGYSYFTLHCTDGKFKGMKCGVINPTFEAPDGFVYSWAYKSSEKYRDPNTGIMPEQYVLGHDQTFTAGMEDDSIYVVDCMFVQDSSCFFSLYASTLATNPIAVIDNNPKITKSCQAGKYNVTFDGSKSWIQEIDHVKGVTDTSRLYHIDRFEWTVKGLPASKGWSDEIVPTFEFPQSGGDFEVQLTVTSGICDSTITYLLHLDELKETRDTMTVFLCDDVRKTTGYTWSEKPDKVYFNYGLDSVILFNEVSSCDSILYLNLVEPVRIPVNKVSMPENLPFVYRGRSYTVDMIDTIPNEACDTTWVLNFVVYKNLEVEMPEVFLICGNEKALSLDFAITQGFSKGYAYSFADPTLPADTVDTIMLHGPHSIVIPFDPTPKPNIYEGTLKLVDSIPWWSVTLPFKLVVRYDAAIVEQKWNDVLYVLAPEYNGGYEFSAFQWYRNDTLLEGETRSYLYQPLHFDAEYFVMLTRAEDSVMMASCPIIPAERQQKTDYPTLIVPTSAKPAQQIPVYLSEPAKMWVFTTSGQIYAYYTLSEGASTITAPSQPGMYIVKMIDQQGQVTAQRLLVR